MTANCDPRIIWSPWRGCTDWTYNLYTAVVTQNVLFICIAFIKWAGPVLCKHMMWGHRKRLNFYTHSIAIKTCLTVSVMEHGNDQVACSWFSVDFIAATTISQTSCSTLPNVYDMMTKVQGMMMLSNGTIFRVIGHMCVEFTGHLWIPRAKDSDAELWCFLWSATE